MNEEIDACANCGTILFDVDQIFVRYCIPLCGQCAKQIDEGTQTLPEPTRGNS